MVIGDSDFAANFALGIQGNRDLFMNALNWLAQQENLIARPAAPAGGSPPDADGRSAAADHDPVACFIIPGLVFAPGIYTWWRRR